MEWWHWTLIGLAVVALALGLGLGLGLRPAADGDGVIPVGKGVLEVTGRGIPLMRIPVDVVNGRAEMIEGGTDNALVFSPDGIVATGDGPKHFRRTGWFTWVDDKEGVTLVWQRWCDDRPASTPEGKGIITFGGAGVAVDFRNGEATQQIEKHSSMSFRVLPSGELGVTPPNMSASVMLPLVRSTPTESVWRGDKLDIRFTRWCTRS